MELKFEILSENSSTNILDIWQGEKNDDEAIEFLYIETINNEKKLSDEIVDLIAALEQLCRIEKGEFYIRRRKFAAVRIVKESISDIKIFSSAGGFYQCDQNDITKLLNYLVTSTPLI